MEGGQPKEEQDCFKVGQAGSSFLHVLGDSALCEGDLGSHWWVRQGRKWLREAGFRRWMVVVSGLDPRGSCSTPLSSQN